MIPGIRDWFIDAPTIARPRATCYNVTLASINSSPATRAKSRVFEFGGGLSCLHTMDSRLRGNDKRGKSALTFRRLACRVNGPRPPRIHAALRACTATRQAGGAGPGPCGSWQCKYRVDQARRIHQTPCHPERSEGSAFRNLARPYWVDPALR